MANALVNTVEIAPGRTEGGVEMLQFALPIPADHREKVRALTYLHETVDFYIKDFCEGERGLVNPLDVEAPDDRVPAINPNAVTLPQAVQIFLTFYICLFI